MDRLVIRDKKLFWTLDPASEKPTNLLGMKLAHSIKSKSGEEIAHSGRKINAVTLKEIQKAKISEIEIDVSDLEGAWVASDVVDTTTGEVLLEANSELTADKVVEDSRVRRGRDQSVLPRARRCGNGHLPDLEARCGEDAAGSADRNLPQAASGRSADAGYGDGLVPRHVLRSAQVRFLAGRTAEVQHQAVREPGRLEAR